jgi:hypothetical protein
VALLNSTPQNRGSIRMSSRSRYQLNPVFSRDQRCPIRPRSSRFRGKDNKADCVSVRILRQLAPTTVLRLRLSGKVAVRTLKVTSNWCRDTPSGSALRCPGFPRIKSLLLSYLAGYRLLRHIVQGRQNHSFKKQ